ncbi:MAG: acyclic terpene utilization AtuA family protein [Pikeienuella sp.]
MSHALKERLVVGGASGFWGEADHATAQLLQHDGLNVLVYDYLAEITMSLMARAKMKDPTKGYAVDFVTSVMKPNLKDIAAQGVKVLSNAGGVNPVACAAALRDEIAKQGLTLKVGVVTGDDLIDRLDEFAQSREMFSGEPWPGAGKMASINAYLGARPIVAALNAGADIVVTGRCVDSALTLAAAMHRFGWEAHDLLAAGSLAGHLLECGPQATGGNFTDWQDAGDIANIGYPIAEIFGDGSFEITKPAGTTGIVSRASVAEQMLYEIGDPQAYLLPDVACDFSQVEIVETAADRVRVSGAKGRPPSGQLKVCATWLDGHRAGHVFQYAGTNARAKAIAFVEAGLSRARGKLRAMNAPDYDDVCIETFGGRTTCGGQTGNDQFEEITVKAAVKHADPRAVGLFLKEVVGGALATPPGLHFFTGAGRPKPSPVLRLFSFLINQQAADIAVEVDGSVVPVSTGESGGNTRPPPHAVVPPEDVPLRVVPLERLAWARSGDKGDSANIGVIARRAELLPFIWAALDDATIREALPTVKGAIERFYLPGTASMNILCGAALGGGGIASLLNDSQGKAFAQRILAVPVAAPTDIVAELEGAT